MSNSSCRLPTGSRCSISARRSLKARRLTCRPTRWCARPISAPQRRHEEGTMLEIADLVTAYGKIEALKGVSLNVEKGGITCLLGPNGAGKTTLMMSIAAILKPRRGSIRHEGEELVGLSPAKI